MIQYFPYVCELHFIPYIFQLYCFFSICPQILPQPFHPEVYNYISMSLSLYLASFSYICLSQGLASRSSQPMQ